MHATRGGEQFGASPTPLPPVAPRNGIQAAVLRIQGVSQLRRSINYSAPADAALSPAPMHSRQFSLRWAELGDGRLGPTHTWPASDVVKKQPQPQPQPQLQRVTEDELKRAWATDAMACCWRGCSRHKRPTAWFSLRPLCQRSTTDFKTPWYCRLAQDENVPRRRTGRRRRGSNFCALRPKAFRPPT